MKLVDSSVLVDIDRGGPGVEERVARLDREGRHAVSAVSVTELFYGVESAYDPEQDAYSEALGALETLLHRFQTLAVSRPVSIRAARLMRELRTEGKRIDDLHDVYIAATALVHGLVLLTANTGDFERVDDLVAEDWETY